MSIEKLEIIGLFSKYNVLIDLSKRCNILVGANGIGKSTILKIIYAIFNSNWIEVSKFPFRTINITLSDNLSVSFSRADLFPSIKEIKKFISNKYDALYNEVSDDMNGHWVFEEKEKCLLIVDELIKAEKFWDFLSNCQNGIQQPISIQKIIRSNESVRSNYGINFEELLLQTINYYKNNSFYNTSRIIKLLEKKQINSHNEEKSFFLDMVRYYEVNNKPAYESEYISPLLKWMSLRPNDFYEWKPQKSFYSLWHGIRTDKMFGQLINCVKTSSLDFVKEIFVSINDFELKDENIDNFELRNKSNNPEEFFLRLLSDEKIIKINRLINRFYYSKDFVISINKRALEHYANSILDNKPPIYSENFAYKSEHLLDLEKIKILKEFFNNNEVIFNINNFINPILCDGSPFIFNIDEILGSINNIEMHENEQYYLNYAHWEFYKFDNTVINELINPANKSREVQLFEEIFSEYSQIKNISIYPSGILLTDVNTEKISKFNLTLIKNSENAIDLSFLSSGEKKILLLLALSIFVKDITIIIDEPELSMSLIWQEKILPDILDRTNLKKIIVATHSPYIASNDCLTDYITYLPTPEVNINE
ncbi:MAG: AAA family ATPase [Bacteroidales bacterium]|nr:AAA family ATPase [Bacteroidales bacterium]